MVRFPVRPLFRVLALGLAALATWAAFGIASVIQKFGAGGGLLVSLGFGCFALALIILALLAGSIAFTSSLPRALVGPDDDSATPTGTV